MQAITAEPLRHRQTKGAETDMPSLPPPRHIPTLPYPDRPSQPLSVLATLRTARSNLLAIWEDRCFEWEVFSTRVASRSLLVCNSPDTVAYALMEHHENFERKSPQ